MAITTQILRFIAVASLSGGAALAEAREPSALFSSQEQALEFTRSIGLGWGEPTVLESGGSDYFGFSRPTFFVYSIGTLKGYMVIGYDRSGQIGFYEVRYPTLKTDCVSIPDTRALAKNLLNQFEPDFADNTREVNFVGSSADLVWPYTAFMSGPGPVVGRTAFRFYKMNGYCSFRVVRFSGRLSARTTP